MRLLFRAIYLSGLLTIMGLSAGCTSPKTEAVVAEPVDDVGLRTVGNEWVWNLPEREESATMRILIDNGGPCDITVQLDAQTTFGVEAGKHAVLRTPNREISLTIVDPESGEFAMSFPAVEEAGRPLFVYNHLAQRDYRIESAGYRFGDWGPRSKIDLPAPRTVQGRVSFFAGQVNLILQPFPDSVTKGSESVLALNAIQRLETPLGDRTWKIVDGENGSRLLFAFDAEGVFVSRMTPEIIEDTSSLYIDNPTDDALILTVDEVETTTLVPDASVVVQMPTGEHKVRVLKRGGEQKPKPLNHNFEVGRKYVWNIDGKRQYDLEFKKYGKQLNQFSKIDTVEGVSRMIRRRTIQVWGIEFFETSASLIFKEFPEKWPVNTKEAVVEISRLDRGYKGDRTDQIKFDLEQMLPTDKGDVEFQDHIKDLLQRPRLDSGDLWKAEAKRARLQRSDYGYYENLMQLIRPLSVSSDAQSE